MFLINTDRWHETESVEGKDRDDQEHGGDDQELPPHQQENQHCRGLC